MIEFTPFDKIPRWKRGIVVSEKIDGTNAAVGVKRLADIDPSGDPIHKGTVVIRSDCDYFVYAQSRKRIIAPGDDNFGFAAWVHEHAQELAGLGEGVHFGEWWGSGIQRGYGLTDGEKRFSLFNSARWREPESRPACCSVVPVLLEWGTPDQKWIDLAIDELREGGSRAAPGFMLPEGVVIYHAASRQLFKQLIENDEAPKGQDV